MSDHSFQIAYARVRGRYSDQTWYSLSQREITNEIYSEIRKIDNEYAFSTNVAATAAYAIAAE